MVQNKIYDFILKSEIGCSSQEIADSLQINRVTLAKYLDVMKEQGLIDFKSVGMAKVWFVEKSPLLKSLKDEGDNNLKNLLDVLAESISVVDEDMKIIWYNKEKEGWAGNHKKNIGKKCFMLHGCNKEDVETCPVALTLKDGKIHRAIKKKKINGKEFTFNMTASPIKDCKEKIVAAVSVSRIVK